MRAKHCASSEFYEWCFLAMILIVILGAKRRRRKWSPALCVLSSWRYWRYLIKYVQRVTGCVQYYIRLSFFFFWWDMFRKNNYLRHWWKYGSFFAFLDVYLIGCALSGSAWSICSFRPTSSSQISLRKTFYFTEKLLLYCNNFPRNRRQQLKMSAPKPGTYTSDDGVQTIEISSAQVSNGEITGNYESKSSPAGSIKERIDYGNFSYVDAVHPNQPYMIRFRILQRPSGFPYALSDSWYGLYQSGNSMLLTGVRAYGDGSPDAQSISLGTKTFSM